MWLCLECERLTLDVPTRLGSIIRDDILPHLPSIKYGELFGGFLMRYPLENKNLIKNIMEFELNKLGRKLKTILIIFKVFNLEHLKNIEIKDPKQRQN